MHLLVLVATGVAVLSITPLAYGQAKPRVVELTGNDQLKFNVTTITARPGRR